MSIGLAADAVTDRAMVLLQDRPVVAAGARIIAALRDCAAQGRVLQIVTPDRCRLTTPLRALLNGQSGTWVAYSASGEYHNGLTGAPLRWDGHSFTPAPDGGDSAPAYRAATTSPQGPQLTVILRSRYRGGELLGGSVGRLCTALQDAPPAGWGPHEPAGHPWHQGELTQYVTQRPGTQWLTVVGGRTLLGTLLYTPAQDALEETVTLSAASPPEAGTPALAWLPSLLADLSAQHRLLSLTAWLGPGATDLTVEPRRAASAAPVGLALATEQGGGSPVPPDVPVRQYGDAWWYDTAGDWQRYQRLTTTLAPR